MQRIFDRQLWDKYISEPDWYLKLDNELTHVHEAVRRIQAERIKEDLIDQVYMYLEDKLESGTIPLQSSGPNWDLERKSIDTVVIHDTDRVEDISLKKLNAMHMLRLYVPYFEKPEKKESYIRGQALWSGHFVNGKQVFYGYHWLIRKTGEAVRLLEDKHLGWHSGNHEINSRSVAICFDDNLNSKTPNNEMLKTAIKIIISQYPNVNVDYIYGHREINKNTICPGNEFLNGWKKTLIKGVRLGI